MKKLLLVCLISLSGCSLFQPTDINKSLDDKIKTQLVTTFQHPDQPTINITPINIVWPVQDVPRDMSKIVPMNTTECLDVPADKRDKAYFDKCGEHPPLADSNLFAGYDQANWNLLNLAMEKMKAKLLEYKLSVDQVNAQREEWRKLNLDEQKKLLRAK